MALLAPGSPAFTYFEGYVLVAESFPEQYVVNVDGGTMTFDNGAATLSDFVLDASGRITDFTFNGVPISRSVASSGAQFAGIDEGSGITGTVHSFRYFDGGLQVIVTTANNSSVEGEVRFEDYVSDGRQFTNFFGNAVRPTVTQTVINSFEDVPAVGGTLYGHVWADHIGLVEIELSVPPLG